MPATKKIFLSGLLAGTLDITAACLQYYFRTGKGPEGVLRFVASGLFGKQAFTGDKCLWIVAGLLIHYLIAMSFTILLALLIINITILQKNRLVTGIVYGVFIWTLMNKIILPLIHTPSPVTLSANLQAMAILIVCIGLPLSFLLIKKRETDLY